MFLIATLIHWVILKDKCIFTVLEEKLTGNPKLEPFNKRLIESVGINIPSSKLKKIEKGVMIGIIVITCLRIFSSNNK